MGEDTSRRQIFRVAQRGVAVRSNSCVSACNALFLCQERSTLTAGRTLVRTLLRVMEEFDRLLA